MSRTELLTLGQRMRIVYRDAAGEITERVIDVERVYTVRTGATAIFAYCHRRGDTRTFDAANILAAMPETTTEVETFGPAIRVLPYSGPTDSASRLQGWD